MFRFIRRFLKRLFKRKSKLLTFIAGANIQRGQVVYVVNGRAYGVSPMALAKGKNSKLP